MEPILTMRQKELLHLIQKMSKEANAPIPIKDIHLEDAGDSTVRQTISVLERKGIIRFIPGGHGTSKKCKIVRWDL